MLEEENSPPRAIPADVGEASTPPNATGDTPLHLRRSSQPRLLGLLIHHLLEHISCDCNEQSSLVIDKLIRAIFDYFLVFVFQVIFPFERLLAFS